MVLTINSDSFPKHPLPVGLCSGDVIIRLKYKLYILTKYYISVFRMVLTINSYLFPQGALTGWAL
jgi:hypothetical protein